MARDGYSGNAAATRPAEPDAPRRIPADALFQGRRELIILHNAEEYRLRVTSNGRLILTK
jgi:hemin uptake protein HemP